VLGDHEPVGLERCDTVAASLFEPMVAVDEVGAPGRDLGEHEGTSEVGRRDVSDVEVRNWRG
jgi:hypothetical protein